MLELVNRFRDLNRSYLSKLNIYYNDYSVIYQQNLFGFRRIWEREKGETIRRMVRARDQNYTNHCIKFESILDDFLLSAYNETQERIRVRQPLREHWSNVCYTQIRVEDIFGTVLTDIRVDDVLITLDMVFRDPASDFALFMSEFEIFWLGKITFTPVLRWEDE